MCFVNKSYVYCQKRSIRMPLEFATQKLNSKKWRHIAYHEYEPPVVRTGTSISRQATIFSQSQIAIHPAESCPVEWMNFPYHKKIWGTNLKYYLQYYYNKNIIACLCIITTYKMKNVYKIMFSILLFVKKFHCKEKYDQELMRKKNEAQI